MEQDKEHLKAFQRSWAYYKYWVMLHSQKAYEEIRKLAKHNDWNEIKQKRYEPELFMKYFFRRFIGSGVNKKIRKTNEILS